MDKYYDTGLVIATQKHKGTVWDDFRNLSIGEIQLKGHRKKHQFSQYLK